MWVEQSVGGSPEAQFSGVGIRVTSTDHNGNRRYLTMAKNPKRLKFVPDVNECVRTNADVAVHSRAFICDPELYQARKPNCSGVVIGRSSYDYIVRHTDGTRAIYAYRHDCREFGPDKNSYWKVLYFHYYERAWQFKNFDSFMEAEDFQRTQNILGPQLIRIEGPFFDTMGPEAGLCETKTLFDHLLDDSL